MWMMKKNDELQKDVQDAIQWEPLLNAAEIGVTAKDGVVSLTGVVDSYAKKMQAEHAAKRVIGVKALVEHIEVKIPNQWTKTDIEIANDVLEILKSNFYVPYKHLKITVENGWVTLDGELPWDYQREAVKEAVKCLRGVKGLTSNMGIKSDVRNAIKQKDVENAIARSGLMDNTHIMVNVSDTTLTLTGTVNSLFQKEEAGRIAWNTPGISQVNNDLTISFNFSTISS
jgi:osmotically-inducible protein OsmY